MGDLFSGPHVILIALVVLLLFGGKKIPELMRGLGKGVREFKDAKDNVKKEIEDHLHNQNVSDIARVADPAVPKQISSGGSAAI
jgi:sec-independent protein translocase protein TatA